MLTPISQTSRSQTPQSVVTTPKKPKAWSGSAGADILEAPPVDLQDPPFVGQVHRHIAYSQNPPIYQLRLRGADQNGHHVWMPVSQGYQRDDGRRLILTLKKKDPSWVQETRYKVVMHLEKAAVSNTRSISALPRG